MRVIILLCLLLLPSSLLSQARKAQSDIEKGKLEEAYERLNKALAKDSLAAAEKYVLASLFFNTSFSNVHLDSAYHYILQAITAYELTPSKEQLKRSGQGFGLNRYEKLKEKIENVGFSRAKRGGKEQDYIEYILGFSTAAKIDSAILLRNEQAYLIAAKEDRYQAYEYFIITYPEASEIPEAKKRYERLLYTEKTGDGKLNSFKQFLRNYPETWHRDDAELVIYNITTGKNSIDSYNEFINQYPYSLLKSQAILTRFSLLNGEEQTRLLNENSMSNSTTDSILNIIALSQQLIIPIISNHEYQLINSHGMVVINQLTNIDEINKCKIDNSSFRLVAVDNEKQLIALDGSVIAQGEIISFTDYGDGSVRITTSTEDYFVNRAGFKTSSNGFEQAHLTWPYIAYISKNKWGLESITGLPILVPKFDSITSFKGQIILQRGKKWGIFASSHFYPALDNEDLETKLTYDHISVIDNSYLYLVIGKKSALWNAEGEVLIPFEEQSIELVDGGYFVDRIDSTLDSRVSSNWYQDISLNQNWMIGTTAASIEVFFKGELIFTVDDASTIGGTALHATKGDSSFFYFDKSLRISLSKNDIIVPINKMGENSSTRHFIYTNSAGDNTVYNNKGEIIDVGKYDRLIDLGDDYLLNFKDDTFSLLDSIGNQLLGDIDGATSLDNGYISYLVDGKFGLFNQNDSTNILPRYDRPVVRYSDKLFVVVENNNYGIVNSKDTILVVTTYDNIEYLNDTIAILTSNFRQQFWDISNSKMLVDNISSYKIEDAGSTEVIKILQGIGYGIWSPAEGLILGATFSDINLRSKGNEVIFIAEKWVEEADLVIMLYYNGGALIRKEVISTKEYQDLSCKSALD